jgi:heme oxygenase
MTTPEITVDATPAESFSQRLRERTWSAHGDAEHSSFMEALIEGRAPRRAYAEMLAQLGAVYEVIESAATTMRDDPQAGPFVFDELTRGDRFTEDIDFLLGDESRVEIGPSPATQEYIARLQDVCFTWPAGFVAHHYTRFMGDLSGGQMIRATLARAYGLEDGQGLKSLTFEGIANRNAFRDEYRARLDAMRLDDEEESRMIDEILLAYRLNTAVIADMDEMFGPELRA